MENHTMIDTGEIPVVKTVDWDEELSEVQLGDKRLNSRLIHTANTLSTHPQLPINQACDDWSDTMAVYRLFRNERVQGESILEPHKKHTVERIKKHPRVLAVQDTSYLDFTKHPKTKGLGPIGTSQQDIQGLLLHNTLALTSSGLPLGLLTINLWTREPDIESADRQTRRKQPIEEKESYKWITALRETMALKPDGVEVITVCDREADIYELFVEAKRLEASLLVRAAQNRALEDDGTEINHIWPKVESQEVVGHLEVHVQGQHGEPDRVAIVGVRFCKVMLSPPVNSRRFSGDQLPPIDLYVVLVKEENAPEGIEPLQWILLTNVPVETFDDAVERVRWYRVRWQIEVYYKVLKTGCKVEDCRLGTAERLKRFIALTAIVAWRLFWMTHISRYAPELPCTAILTEHEWKALYTRIHHTKELPDELPTARQSVRWIARLGGFLGRKCDGEPGITTIWRGWQRLQDIAETYRILQDDT